MKMKNLPAKWVIPIGSVIAVGQAIATAVCLFVIGKDGIELSKVEFILFGSLLFLGINMVMFMYERREIKSQLVKNFAVVQILLFIIIILAEVMGIYISPYIVPYVFFGIAVSSLISKHLALYLNTIIGVEIVLVGTLLGSAEGVVVTQSLITVIGGGILVLLQRKSDSRIRTIGTSAVIAPLYVAILFISKSMGWIALENMTFDVFAVFINPIIGVILAIGVLPIFEWTFKILTAYRVAELGDVSKGMLLELSQKAKGTYYHSVAVANITAECAAAIGEDAALARICAMYHDIGKTVEPTLFIENQNEETGNPHDKMTPELSVALIRKHAKDGGDILSKHRIPSIVVECAMQHHGTLPIRYFYERAKKFTQGEINLADYSYNESKPTSKIAALIMICDASEAAIRAKGSLAGAEVDSVVKAIIEERMMLGQFDECPITFGDLHMIRETIVASFAGVMHKRVNYPKFTWKG